jgi:hypothetical protein
VRGQTDRSLPEELELDVQPIEFLTENGYSIYRPWEIGGVTPPANGSFLFLVRSPEGRQRNVLVEIAESLITRMEIHTSGRVQLVSAFWICCGERHLANFLWEQGECPPDDHLIVNHIDPDEMILGTNWDRGFPGGQAAD